MEGEIQLLTLPEHILRRAENYVGETVPTKLTTWVWDDEACRMILRPITYVPGLFKLFDEVLVNAVDACTRLYQKNPSLLPTIKVSINVEQGILTVRNSGGLSVRKLPQYENRWEPELAFGEFLSSENYRDDQENRTGGRNGFGAKLANFFSRSFSVEVQDAHRRKRFRMTWSDGMNTRSEPSVERLSSRRRSRRGSYTAITFQPDFAKFGVAGLDSDLVALMTKRVYDVAGCNSFVDIYLNDQQLDVKGFSQYVQLYLPAGEKPHPHVFAPPTEGWEVCVCATEDGSGQQLDERKTSHVGFVNSVWTPEGTHFGHVQDALVEALMPKIKESDAQAWMLRSHLWLFVNAHIANPQFNSQTKTKLTTPPKKFSSKFTCTPEFASNGM